MFRSRTGRRYSLYHDRTRKGTASHLIRLVVLLFVGYQLLTLLLLTSLEIDSTSMTPTLAVSDRVLAGPAGYGARLPLLPWTTPALREPQRGDIVVVASPFHRRPGPVLSLLDPVVRFFSANHVSLVSVGAAGWDNPYVVKRVVGLPGDTVEIHDYVAQVTPADGSQSTSEHALSAARYDLDLAEIPADSGLLFFSDTEPLTLGQDEYYVLGDNRAASVDSRHFGPVLRAQLRQRVFFRYWPLTRFGVPAN